MTTFLTHRQRIDSIEYAISYSWNDTPGAGYSFPCDKDGTLLPGLTPAALENLERCQKGEGLTFNGIAQYENHYYEPATIECEQCRGTVTLSDAVTNECDRCQTLYNGFGQRLAPRDQWEEDY